jgi:hypothetical protein
MAPYARTKLQPTHSVTTHVVFRSDGSKSAAKRGRLNVPRSFFSFHTGDSGRNGRTTIRGMAGISPENNV